MASEVARDAGGAVKANAEALAVTVADAVEGKAEEVLGKVADAAKDTTGEVAAADCSTSSAWTQGGRHRL